MIRLTPFSARPQKPRCARFQAPPFLAVVAKNSPRAGRARLLQGENYV